ncbi:hypothetical protein BJ165DRAFT_1530814 [Panaeolus papilionaceus]|nr:hypothetical protein BJ165DRAFT_1530814 [Panaeolus papilionaceus]
MELDPPTGQKKRQRPPSPPAASGHFKRHCRNVLPLHAARRECIVAPRSSGRKTLQDPISPYSSFPLDEALKWRRFLDGLENYDYPESSAAVAPVVEHTEPVLRGTEIEGETVTGHEELGSTVVDESNGLFPRISRKGAANVAGDPARETGSEVMQEAGDDNEMIGEGGHVENHHVMPEQVLHTDSFTSVCSLDAPMDPSPQSCSLGAVTVAGGPAMETGSEVAQEVAQEEEDFEVGMESVLCQMMVGGEHVENHHVTPEHVLRTDSFTSVCSLDVSMDPSPPSWSQGAVTVAGSPAMGAGSKATQEVVQGEQCPEVGMEGVLCSHSFAGVSAPADDEQMMGGEEDTENHHVIPEHVLRTDSFTSVCSLDAPMDPSHNFSLGAMTVTGGPAMGTGSKATREVAQGERGPEVGMEGVLRSHSFADVSVPADDEQMMGGQEDAENHHVMPEHVLRTDSFTSVCSLDAPMDPSSHSWSLSAVAVAGDPAMEARNREEGVEAGIEPILRSDSFAGVSSLDVPQVVPGVQLRSVTFIRTVDQKDEFETMSPPFAQNPRRQDVDVRMEPVPRSHSFASLRSLDCGEPMGASPDVDELESGSDSELEVAGEEHSSAQMECVQRSFSCVHIYDMEQVDSTLQETPGLESIPQTSSSDNVLSYPHQDDSRFRTLLSATTSDDIQSRAGSMYIQEQHSVPENRQAISPTALGSTLSLRLRLRNQVQPILVQPSPDDIVASDGERSEKSTAEMTLLNPAMAKLYQRLVSDNEALRRNDFAQYILASERPNELTSDPSLSGQPKGIPNPHDADVDDDLDLDDVGPTKKRKKNTTMKRNSGRVRTARLVREHMVTVMNRTRDAWGRLSDISSVPRGQVLVFNTNGENGPSIINCQFFLEKEDIDDCLASAATKWNECARKHFKSTFYQKHPEETSNTKEVDSCFQVHLEYLKDVFSKQHTQSRSSKMTATQKNRRIGRRRDCCSRRIEGLGAHARNPNIKRLHRFAKENLTWDVCSGDESSSEGCKARKDDPRYITTLTWRAKAVRTFMGHLDLLYLSLRYPDGENPTPGKFPVQRLHPLTLTPPAAARMEKAHDDVVPGLPINFYCEEWLKEQTPEQIAKLHAVEAVDLTIPDEILDIARRYIPVTSRKGKPLPMPVDL